MKIKQIVLSVLLLCCTFVVFAQKEITVEAIWKKYQFIPKSVPGFASMPNSDYYSLVTETGITRHSFETGDAAGEILTWKALESASNGELGTENLSDYEFDASCSKILLAFEEEPIYRRSSCAYYYVYDLQKNTVVPVADKKKGKQIFADFSADGSKVAFVRDYNLFYMDLATQKEYQVTFDGEDNKIRYGLADWVYEEELSMSKYFYWSPDGSKIAYLRFDESRVKEFSMTIWGELYPEEYKYKYPKAGEDNSIVDIYVYDLKTGKSTQVEFPREDCYYPRIYWLSNSVDLMVLKLNRLQNKLEFYRCNTQTGAKDVVLTDENKWWLEITDDYYFLEDNNTVIFTSERDGFNHIYKAEFGKEPVQLTSGKYEVKGISAIDFPKKTIFYISNESAVLNQDLYSINFDGKKKRMLTDGTGWNDPTFNSNAHFYLNMYSNSNMPPVYTLYNSIGKKLYTIEDNASFREKIAQYGFAKKEHFTFTTDEGISLNGWMIKPANFNQNSGKKYPVLMYVYGGPGSQEVTNSYFRGNDHAWYQMLAQKGYIVVCVDGRGTASRGDEFKKVIYKQMGKYEAIDQIATANYLKTLPYVDGDRIGIWGWSFGGYLSSLAMFKGKGVFKMAMSVAPVTNWRYYDNIYTERFLQKPQDNPEGYDDNAPCFSAKDLQGAYLLVHGTADDNVHFQNAMDLVTQLNKAEKQYEQFFYPNKNHFIYGGNTRYQLYTKLTDFLLKNL